MGVPCWLRADNDYYVQKRAGLGLPDQGLRTFLAQARVLGLERQMSGRAAWLAKLEEAYRAPAPTGARPAAGAPAPAGGPVKVAPISPGAPGAIKPRDLSGHLRLTVSQLEIAVGWERQQHTSWQAAAEHRQKIIDELKAGIATLENGRKWLEEQRANWQKLAADREAHITELNQARQWLDEQRINWQKIAADREAIITDLRRFLGTPSPPAPPPAGTPQSRAPSNGTPGGPGNPGAPVEPKAKTAAD
jgi:hypothetical protein